MPQNPLPRRRAQRSLLDVMRGTLLLLAGLLAPAAAPAAPAAEAPSVAKTPAAKAPAAKPPSTPPPAAAIPAAVVCDAPTPPPAAARPVKPVLPEKPACLDAKGGCPGWEAYSFNDAVKGYNLQAQAFRPIAEAYIQKLNAFVKASSDYAQCEVNAMQR